MDQKVETFYLRSNLDLSNIEKEKERVVQFVSEFLGKSVIFDLEDGVMTQPSLQLFFSSIKEMKLKGIPVSLGPISEGRVPNLSEGTDGGIAT